MNRVRKIALCSLLTSSEDILLIALFTPECFLRTLKVRKQHMMMMQRGITYPHNANTPINTLSSVPCILIVHHFRFFFGVYLLKSLREMSYV